MNKQQLTNKVNELARVIADTTIGFGQVPENIIEEYKKYKSELVELEIKEINQTIEK